jgi:sugar-specific transcriptional regulator TrmB
MNTRIINLKKELKKVRKKAEKTKAVKGYVKVVNKINELAEGTKDETRINPKTHVVHKKWTPSERKVFGIPK